MYKWQEEKETDREKKELKKGGEMKRRKRKRMKEQEHQRLKPEPKQKYDKSQR